MPHYVIIGDGIAGASAAEKLRELSDAKITVLTDEAEPLYNRIQIKEFAKDAMPEDAVKIHDHEFYEENDIELRLGTRVEQVYPERQELETRNGEVIDYDRLLVAAGGTPKDLPVENSTAKGIYNFWTFQDARAIKSKLERADNAVIVGAGLLGIDLAAVAAEHGLENIRYVMRGNRWWRYALDMEGAEIMHRAMEDKGVELVFKSGVERFEVDDAGRVETVHGSNGESWDADFVGVAIGLDYSTGMIEDTAVETGSGIKVDEYMRTGEDLIYAAGDITRYRDTITGSREQNGSWGSAQQQGETAARTMVAEEEGTVEKEEFRWVSSYTITHFDFPFMSFGHPTIGDEEASRKYGSTEYRKLAFRDGQLVGGVLIGDIRTQPKYKKVIQQELEVADQKEVLLKEDFGVDDLE